MTRDEMLRQMETHWWWHSIDLGQGVVTPGRKSLELLATEYATAFDGIELAGKRVLDIRAWNGAFSIEATRRGAQVTALDNYTWNNPVLRGREAFNFAVPATSRAGREGVVDA